MLIKSSRWKRVFIKLTLYWDLEKAGNFQGVIFMQIVPFKPFSREIGPFENEMENMLKRFFGIKHFAKPFAEEWAPTVDVSETNDKYNSYSQSEMKSIY